MRPNREEVVLRLGRRERREGAWAAAEWLRQFSKLPSVACCQLTPIRGEDGAVLRLAGGTVATFGGLRRCSSPWSCPTCATRIGAGRTDELVTAVQRWHAKGFSVGMATLTMSHRSGDSLADLWDAKARAWTALRDSGRLRRPKRGSALAGAQVAGYVVKTEVTWGGNGWHVHLHVLVFFRVAPVKLSAALTAWGDAAWPLWESALASRGFQPVRDEGGYHAAPIRQGHEAADVATYVAKDGAPMEVLAAAREIALDTGKEGRGRNVNQWGLLARAMTGDPSSLMLWAEWEDRSKGRRAIVWTKALKRELLGQEDDVSDDELAADSDNGVALVGIHEWAWKQLRREHRPAALLTAAEVGYRQVRDAGASHFDSLQAAQDDVVAMLEDLGVPANHVRTLPLPQPPAPVPPDLDSPRSGLQHHQGVFSLAHTPDRDLSSTP